MRHLTAAFMALSLTACTAGLIVGDGQKAEFAAGVSPPAPIPAASPIADGDGYVRFLGFPHITGNEQRVSCFNPVTRWYERQDRSLVTLALNGSYGPPLISMGVNDAAGTCQPITSDWQPLGPAVRLPGRGDLIRISISAVNESSGKVDFAQIATDLGTLATSVAAGPTSGLAVAVTTATLAKTAVSEAVNKAIALKSQGGRPFPPIGLTELRKQEPYSSLVTTTSNQPVGSVSVQAFLFPSIFIDAASRGADGQEEIGFSVTPYQMRRTHIYIGQQGAGGAARPRFEEWLKAADGSFESDYSDLKQLSNPGDIQVKLRSFCEKLDSVLDDRGLTQRDRLIAVWAYLSDIPKIWGNASLFPEDGTCLPGTTRDMLARMGLNRPGEALTGSKQAGARRT